MKYSISILIILGLLISCSVPRYVSGRVTDITHLTDSITTADNIHIPDTSYWVKTYYVSHDKEVLNSYLYVTKVKRNTYILSILDDSGELTYKYRVE